MVHFHCRMLFFSLLTLSLPAAAEAQTGEAPSAQTKQSDFPKAGTVGSGDVHDIDDIDEKGNQKDQSKIDWTERFVSRFLDSATFLTRYRSDFDSRGISVRDQLQGRVNLKFKYYVPATNGKLAVKAEAMTGSRIDSNWIDTGIGQDLGLRRSFSLRHLYLQFQAAPNVLVTAGFLPIMPQKVKADAVLSPDRDAWFDGVRVNWSTNRKVTAPDGTQSEERKREFSFSYGWIKGVNQFNVWERAHFNSQPNAVQIFVRVNEGFVNFVQEYSRINNRDFARTMVEILPGALLKYVDSVVGEYLVSDLSRKTQGYSVQVQKSFGHFAGWLAWSRRMPETLAVEEGQIPRENLFRTNGPLFSGFLQWERSKTYQPYIRWAKGLSGNVEVFDSPTFRAGPFARQSSRWEVGLRVNFRPRK